MVGARATVVLFVSCPCLLCLPAVQSGTRNHVPWLCMRTALCEMQKHEQQADKQQQVMSSCRMHALPLTWFLEEQGDDVCVSMRQQAQLI